MRTWIERHRSLLTIVGETVTAVLIFATMYLMFFVGYAFQG